jgi:3-hydroxybutyryl-CoA dehydratase
MRLGDKASATRAFTAGDVAAYGVLGGPPASEGLVPDPLVGAIVSCLLGVRLPGPGTNYLKQDFDYAAPARIDEAITASVEVVRLRPDKHLVDLMAECRGEDGRLICAGRALVHVGDVAA